MIKSKKLTGILAFGALLLSAPHVDALGKSIPASLCVSVSGGSPVFSSTGAIYNNSTTAGASVFCPLPRDAVYGTIRAWVTLQQSRDYAAQSCSYTGRSYTGAYYWGASRSEVWPGAIYEMVMPETTGFTYYDMSIGLSCTLSGHTSGQVSSGVIKIYTEEK